ncbi:uncharacterized protein DUF4133 [Chitinophaga niastensis]|uniref:Uncharacterized protein DUF4133 n=1 Tax=Chitinophaga niastensis TaxID=536980 RepID=A0A2P8H9E1_CHINA|nr:DUF4133 domain-containing protein [Chitinophaga niastensis]PSL42824.1 uncharacterized protein DUF4133 [Chitinophaga niastensis]
MSTVYEINKGINKSIEFRGIKAQYIVYLAAGLVFLLLFFTIIYIIGINIYVCVVIILASGAALFTTVQRFSKKYGQHGLIKKAAQSRLPSFIYSSSRKIFFQLSESDKHEADKETGKRTTNL